jgi:hypothetical protein
VYKYFILKTFLLSFSNVLAFDCAKELAAAKNTHLFEFKDISVRGVLSGSYPENSGYRIQTAFVLKRLVDKNCVKYSEFNLSEDEFKNYLKDLQPSIDSYAKQDQMKRAIYGTGQSDLTKVALLYLAKENESIKNARNNMMSNTLETQHKKNEIDNFMKGLKCDSKDVSDQMPPVRHQDGTGWCDAFVSADLLSQKTGKNISAMDISLNYQKHLESDDIIMKTGVNLSKASGSHIALHKTLSEGYCLESEIPSEVADGAPFNIADRLENFEQFKKAYNSQFSFCYNFVYGSPFPEVPFSDFSNILRWGQDDKYLTQFRNRACKRSKDNIENSITVAIGSDTYSEDYDSKMKIVQAAVDQLNKGKAVGFEHPFKMMYEPKYLEAEKEDSWHASSIVGMEKDSSGECQFKVRGTLGSRAKYIGRKSHDGYYWISARELAANARLLFYIN